MSFGPEKIILILVVALIVFGPQRLPEVARQVGAAMRELRKMQDTVRGELEQVLHPDFSAPSSVPSQDAGSSEDINHAVLPPSDMAPGGGADTSGSDYSNDDVTDDGFAGPRSFS